MFRKPFSRMLGAVLGLFGGGTMFTPQAPEEIPTTGGDKFHTSPKEKRRKRRAFSGWFSGGEAYTQKQQKDKKLRRLKKRIGEYSRWRNRPAHRRFSAPMVS